MSLPPDIGLHQRGKGPFVQTEREIHEIWAALSIKRPAAAAILHYFAANVGNHNAVVVSRTTIAKLLGISVRTVHRAIDDLAAGNWIQVVRIGAGRECAYVLNDRVVWAERRDRLRFSAFSAEVIVDAEDQSPETLHGPKLHRLPNVGEVQLPHGPGLPPESQPFFDGLEPDLPAIGEE